MTKKILCMILATLLVCFCFAACNGESGKPSDTEGVETTLGAGDIEDTEEPEETVEPLDIEVFGDGSPVEYNIMVRASRYDYLYWDTSATSDAVQASVFERNAYIEEQFNIGFTISEVVDNANSFTTALTAGTGAYDLICYDYWWGLETNGFFHNLADMQEIDLSDPYWYDGWNKNTKINGVSYSIVGDASLEVLQNIEIMFFNSTIAGSYGLELYDLVEDGEWTLAKLMEINTLVAQNLDDTDPTNDVYGTMYDRHSMRAQLASAGLRVTEIAENGAIELVASEERNINICDKVTQLINSAEVEYTDENTRVRDYSLFAEGRSLFYATGLIMGRTLKELDLDFNYGVLITPKYDEESEYISTNYGASVFSIPLDAKDAHMSAMILNALNYLSADSVVYTYYDQVMKYRVVDSPEDAEMIDLARANMYMDFGFIYNGNLGLLSAFYSAVNSNTSVADDIASVAESAQTSLVTLIESFHQ